MEKYKKQNNNTIIMYSRCVVACALLLMASIGRGGSFGKKKQIWPHTHLCACHFGVSEVP